MLLPGGADKNENGMQSWKYQHCFHLEKVTFGQCFHAPTLHLFSCLFFSFCVKHFVFVSRQFEARQKTKMNFLQKSSTTNHLNNNKSLGLGKSSNTSGTSGAANASSNKDFDKRRKIAVKCLELEGMLESQG